MLLKHIRSAACVIALLALPLPAARVNAAPNAAPPQLAPPQQADPLHLTPAQQAKAQSISTTINRQIDGIRSNNALSRDAKVKQIVALLTSLETQQRAILDPKQIALYDKVKAQRDAADPLHLTVAQKVELELANDERTSMIRTLVSNRTASVDARARAVEKIVTDGKQQEKSILSPAQIKELARIESAQQARDPLHCTLHQRIELQILNNDARLQQEAIQANAKLTAAQKQTRLASLQQSVRQSQEAVLTAQQRATLGALQKTGH